MALLLSSESTFPSRPDAGHQSHLHSHSDARTCAHPLISPPTELYTTALPTEQTHRFIFWVGTQNIRSQNTPTYLTSPTTFPPSASSILPELQIRDHGEEFLSQRRPGEAIFWFKSYPAAASACSILKANGKPDVQMAVVWATGLMLYSVEQMAFKLGTRGVRARAAGRLFGGPLSVEDLKKMVVQFRWMREILYVPGLYGHVQVPKHVLDQREEDGDADNWGKLQRGLLDEMYLACGRTEPARCDALLSEMTSGYRFGSISEC